MPVKEAKFLIDDFFELIPIRAATLIDKCLGNASDEGFQPPFNRIFIFLVQGTDLKKTALTIESYVTKFIDTKRLPSQYIINKVRDQPDELVWPIRVRDAEIYKLQKVLWMMANKRRYFVCAAYGATPEKSFKHLLGENKHGKITPEGYMKLIKEPRPAPRPTSPALTQQ